MKLLIITQKVDINDDNLGFFHRWLEKFAQKLEKLFVICLAQGEYHLAENVEVFSLGKQKGFSKLSQFFRLQKYLFKYLPQVDGVFVHMCPIYAIVAFPLTKIFRKKLVFWYAHGAVTSLLKIAEKLVDKIVTSSLAGCRIESKKIEVLGQGIDTDLFKPRDTCNVVDKKLKVLSAGRIAPSKDLETLILAIDILINQRGIKNLHLRILGRPHVDSERRYLEKLKNLVQEKKLENYIEFLGSVPNAEMPKYYQNSDLFINLSHTGSLDKAVLEAMACGCLVLTCNEAYQQVLDKKYLFRKKDYQDLAEKIINLRTAPKDKSLREIVKKNHSLDNLVDKIIYQFL